MYILKSSGATANTFATFVNSSPKELTLVAIHTAIVCYNESVARFVVILDRRN